MCPSQQASPQHIPNTSQSSLNTRHAHHNIYQTHPNCHTLYTRHAHNTIYQSTPVIKHYIPDMHQVFYTPHILFARHATVYLLCVQVKDPMPGNVKHLGYDQIYNRLTADCNCCFFCATPTTPLAKEKLALNCQSSGKNLFYMFHVYTINSYSI